MTIIKLNGLNLLAQVEATTAAADDAATAAEVARNISEIQVPDDLVNTLLRDPQSTSTAAAQLLIQQALDGSGALPTTPRGAWDNLTAYDARDLVSHGGSNWIASEDTNAGEEPGVSAKWVEFGSGVDATARASISALATFVKGHVDLDTSASIATTEVNIPAGTTVMIAMLVAADDWTPATSQDLLDQYPGADKKLRFFIDSATGRLAFAASKNGTTSAGQAINQIASTATPGAVDGEFMWVGVFFNPDNGSGVSVVRFLSGVADATSIAQFGTPRTSSSPVPLTLFNSTAPLQIGNYTFNGKVRRLIIRTGMADPGASALSLTAGTSLVDLDLSDPDTTATTYNDTLGHDWTPSDVTPVSAEVRLIPAGSTAPQPLVRRSDLLAYVGDVEFNEAAAADLIAQGSSDPHRLRGSAPWFAALTEANTEPADVVFLGSSITDGAVAGSFANRWINRTIEHLRNTYQDTDTIPGGLGYVPSWSGSAPSHPGIVRVGGIQSDGFGLGRYVTRLESNTQSWAITETATSFVLAFGSQTDTGDVDIFIDDVLVDTLDTTHATSSVGGLLWTSDSLPAGSHTIKVQPAAGTTKIQFEGVHIRNGDENAGIRGWGGGRGGSKLSFWDEPTKMQWIDTVAAIAPSLLVIEWGTNDYAANPQTTPGAFYDLGITILDQVLAELTVQPTLVFPIYVPRATTTTLTYSWEQYADKVRDLADHYGGETIEWSRRFGDPIVNEHGLFNADQIHLSGKGSRLGGRVMADYLRIR